MKKIFAWLVILGIILGIIALIISYFISDPIQIIVVLVGGLFLYLIARLLFWAVDEVSK